MIEEIQATTSSHIRRIGGKACGLIRLMSAGLPVPESWVIAAPVSLDESARTECLDIHLPHWWAQVSQLHPGSLWAVRSSAVAEDLADASFAGVYETVLSLSSLDSIREALTRCWEAAGSSRARSYLDQQEFDSGGIALVLQRMVVPRAAGVLLTENPLKPFGSQVVIDAAHGLGEAVVGGLTDPDHVVLDRISGAVVEQRIGTKEVEMVCSPDGSLKRQVAPERRETLCLSEHDLRELHRLSSRVTEQIGPRRDLEWAVEDDRLYLLQDRPITNLPPLEPTVVWSRRFGDEYLSEYITPLGHALMNPWLSEPNINEVLQLQGRADLVPMTKIRLHDGYAYINGDYVLELARAVPLGSREGPLTAWFAGSQWEARVRTIPFSPPALAATLRAPHKDKGRGSAKDNLKALERHCNTILDLLGPKLAQDYTSLSDEEWLRQWDEVDQLGQDHFRVIRWGMALHLPVRMSTLGLLIEKWSDQEPIETLQTLITGLPGTHTAEINEQIHELGVTAREDPEVAEALLADIDGDQARGQSPRAQFWTDFDRFMNAHGHRCATREISAPRWRETPDLVLGLVRAQLRAGDSGISPARREAQAVGVRQRAQRDLLASVGRGPLGQVRRRLVSGLIGSIQDFARYRENQRYYLDYILCHLHLLANEQGRRLVESGVLVDAGHVYLLDGQSFWEAIDPSAQVDVAGLRDRVEAARAHREKHQRRLPPTFLYDDVPTEGEAATRTDRDDTGGYRGVAASSGVGRGPARVVRSLADLADVRVGDVLVASNIDPGWTSVFPLIAGLVTEVGGVLSHGAILAREYGIPTVTGVRDAVELFDTTIDLVVDGTDGLVHLAEETQANSPSSSTSTASRAVPTMSSSS